MHVSAFFIVAYILKVTREYNIKQTIQWDIALTIECNNTHARNYIHRVKYLVDTK